MRGDAVWNTQRRFMMTKVREIGNIAMLSMHPDRDLFHLFMLLEKLESK
jgi:hypothetical protein